MNLGRPGAREERGRVARRWCTNGKEDRQAAPRSEKDIHTYRQFRGVCCVLLQACDVALTYSRVCHPHSLELEPLRVRPEENWGTIEHVW